MEAAPAGTAAASAVVILDAVLYALMMMLVAFLTSGLAAHMIGLLHGLGVGASIAVWAATLVGIGQSTARLVDVLFGARLHPVSLGVLASALLPLAFCVGFLVPAHASAGIAFALIYGAGIGLSWILRGTLPLVLFDPRFYGSTVGLLLAPSFYLPALAPLAYAAVIERFGPQAALWLSAGCAVVILVAALLLRLRYNLRPGRGITSADR
jgi:hypothetical protein